MDIPMKLLVAFLTLYLASSSIEADKILLIPGPHYSHVNLFSTAGRALKDDGHDVYVLTVQKFEPNVIKHGLNPLTHVSPGEDFYKRMEPHIKKMTKGDISITKILSVVLPMISDLCKEINYNEDLMKKVQEVGFDLVINDATMFYACLYMIPYKFNIKHISLTALHDPWTFGVSGMPSMEPSQLIVQSNRMTFLQRAMNVIPFTMIAINPMSFIYSQEHMRELVPDKPYKSFKQLIAESQIVLVNHDVTCVGYPRVSAPHYKYIGGASAKKAKPLPKDLQEFADGAKNGLIILSFGSVETLQILWKEMKPIFMNAFKRIPQRVIVQYGLDDIHGAPENVKLLKWLPQNDLLGHPNTRIFITHGGNNGQLEAVFHGVPVLTMAFAGDQRYNALQAYSRGFGLIMERLELSEELIVSNIAELMNNKSYSENIKKCSEITKSMPSSQENVVFWVNHILRFGGDHLRSPAQDMPMYQVLMLDVFALFALIILTVFVILILFCRCLLRACSQKAKSKRD